MFCKSGSVQSESYLFCAEKNIWRDGTFRVYSYLRCSFLLLFQALCIVMYKATIILWTKF